MTRSPSPNIIRAINLASHLHREHVRRDELKTPYASHLFAVAMFLSSVTDDEDVIVAGLMHDSLEDVPDYTYDDLARDTNTRVADIVSGVTENKALPYKERKLEYLKALSTGSLESMIVSIADKVHNASSFKDMHEDHKHDGHHLVYNEVLRIARERIAVDSKEYALVDMLEKELS